MKISKLNLKKQRNLLKNNETIYHDKVSISTRFYLQLLKRSQFLTHFVDSENYEYAAESEKAVTSPEVPKNKTQNKKEVDRTTYNLRSNEAKTERKVFYETTRTRKKASENETQIIDQKLPERKRKPRKEPLAPIIEEIKNREPLKTVNKGAEIDKIAEKLKNLVKPSVEEKLDRELLSCKESFDENLEPILESQDVAKDCVGEHGE